MNSSDLQQWIAKSAAVLFEKKDWLTDLDREIGDADHGLNMARGFAKAAEKVQESAPASCGDVLKTCGMTLLSSVGGASGPLYGMFFIKAAAAAGGAAELDLPALAKVLRAGTDGLLARGGAHEGDKTMADVWLPVCAALENSGDALPAALNAAAKTAEEAMQATAPMQAKKGRASYLGERSVGHIDPGAASGWLIIQALAECAQ